MVSFAPNPGRDRPAGAQTEGGRRIRRPISRVLCPSLAEAWEGGGHSSRPHIAVRLARPTRTARTGDGPTLASQGAPSLFGLAPGGACHAVPVTRHAVRSYRTLSPLPAVAPGSLAGGLLSVALSLGSRPAGVTRRLVAVEPGLSSSPLGQGLGGPRPPGRLIRGGTWSAADRWSTATKISPSPGT